MEGIVLKRFYENCDRCGKPVPLENDAVVLDALLGRGWEVIFGQPRHLLPVVEEGFVLCTGSPSRAQYLPGQKLDPRPEYSYDPKIEPIVRAAYERMLALTREG